MYSAIAQSDKLRKPYIEVYSVPREVATQQNENTGKPPRPSVPMMDERPFLSRNNKNHKTGHQAPQHTPINNDYRAAQNARAAPRAPPRGRPPAESGSRRGASMRVLEAF